MVDANLAALRQHEDKTEKAELNLERLIQAIIDEGLIEDYNNIVSRLGQLTDKYGIEYDIEDFVKGLV